MLSERYRPKTWTEFVGQPVIGEILDACGDDWLFEGGGERWLFESDGIAGCGKTGRPCARVLRLRYRAYRQPRLLRQ